MTAVRTWEELKDRQAEAARAISGGYRSWWNGKVRSKEPDPGKHIAMAGWDGVLYYDDAQIIEPLQRMFREAGQEHTPAELEEFRNALRAVLHDNMHLIKPWGRSHGERAEITAYADDPAARALEEGITEAWTIRNLDRYIDELGLEEIAPGIKSVTARPKYPHLVAAADELAERLGEHTELGRDEALRMIAIQPADRKWRMVSGMVYEHSELKGLGLTADQRSRAMDEIAAAMKKAYEPLTGIVDHPDDPHQQRRAAEVGRDAGTEAWENGQEKLAELVRRHGAGAQLGRDPAAHLAGDPAVRPLTHARRLDPGRFGGRASGSSSPGLDRGGPDR